MADEDRDSDLRGYLDAVAAGTATPGGGSVAAIVGAMGAALGEMVGNFTLGRERYAAVEEEIRPARDRLTAVRAVLTAAAAADERAYAAYRAAAALPRGSDAEKAARIAAMQEALVSSTDVPLLVARAATETVEIMEIIARAGNPHVRSDAALGALLAEAALRGALLNVRGNAAKLSDPELAGWYVTEANRLESRGRAARRAFRVATDGADN